MIRIPVAAGIAIYLMAVAILGPFIAPLIGLGKDASPLGVRFGATGIVFGSSGFLLLAFLLAGLAAGLLGQRKALLTMAGLSMLTALGLLAASGMFALDFFQIRGLLPAIAQGVLRTSSIQAVIQAWYSASVLAVIAYSCLSAAKALRRREGPHAPVARILVR